MPAVLDNDIAALIEHTPSSCAWRGLETVLCLTRPPVQEAGTANADGRLGAAAQANELDLRVWLAATPAQRVGFVARRLVEAHSSTARTCSTVGEPLKPSVPVGAAVEDRTVTSTIPAWHIAPPCRSRNAT